MSNGFTLLSQHFERNLKSVSLFKASPNGNLTFASQLRSTGRAVYFSHDAASHRVLVIREANSFRRFGRILTAQNNIVWVIAAPACLLRHNAHSKINWASEYKAGETRSPPTVERPLESAVYIPTNTRYFRGFPETRFAAALRCVLQNVSFLVVFCKNWTITGSRSSF